MSIFPKLVLALLVVVIPLYGIGLLTNQLGESRLKEELSNSLKTRVDFFMNSLETEHEHIWDVMQEYIHDKDLHHLTYLSGTMKLFEFTEVIRRIESDLSRLKGSSVYADSVSAHILTLQRTLSSERSISFGLEQDFAAVQPLVENGGTGMFFYGGDAYLAVSFPTVNIPLGSGFILAVKLNLAAMEASLQSFRDGEETGAVLLLQDGAMTLGRFADDEMAARVGELLSAKAAQSEKDGIAAFEHEGRSYMLAYRHSSVIDADLVAFLPIESMLGPIDSLRQLLWVLSALAVIIIVSYSYWLYRLIHKPLQNLVRSFRKVEQGQLAAAKLPRSNDEFEYLFQRFNLMVENFDIMVQQVYEQRLRVQSAELKQLQAQINPHFLYNTYFILYRLAKLNDNESVARFSQYLGEYFQYITRNAADDAPIEMELRHARTYAEIQNIRFKDRIQVEFVELPDELKSLPVPRLIVQPIIENAYKHGLEMRRKEGFVRVAIRREGVDLLLSVEDNGDKLTDERLSRLSADLLMPPGEQEYTGLLNVHRRLQIRFGVPYGITVSRSEIGGMRVVVTIPVGGTSGASKPDRTGLASPVPGRGE